MITQETKGGKPVTLWIIEENLEKIDQVCEAVGCSRSWLVGKIIAASNIGELLIEANK
jgi:hypothetical protein